MCLSKDSIAIYYERVRIQHMYMLLSMVTWIFVYKHVSKPVIQFPQGWHAKLCTSQTWSQLSNQPTRQHANQIPPQYSGVRYQLKAKADKQLSLTVTQGFFHTNANNGLSYTPALQPNSKSLWSINKRRRELKTPVIPWWFRYSRHRQSIASLLNFSDQLLVSK